MERSRRAPMRGAWIEISQDLVWCACPQSRPTRGAWIEMQAETQAIHSGHRRAPHGARGLKFGGIKNTVVSISRAPHGARGLKFLCPGIDFSLGESRPTRGAWIEMAGGMWTRRICPSRPTRGAWIEI